jgi:hypothetical protein
MWGRRKSDNDFVMYIITFLLRANTTIHVYKR